MTEQNAGTGWPDQIDWRYQPGDEAAVAAQVVQATTYLIQGGQDAALKVFTDSGLPAWRHVPHALAILAATIGAHSSDGENVTGLENDLLDEHSPSLSPPPMHDPARHRDVNLTVVSAVRHWSAGDYERLTELARTSPLPPVWWAWGAVVLLARICNGPGGPEWLLRVSEQIADAARRGAQ